nr:MAG TPA: hypothetical protein [Caudoviricetes sp.]
MISLTSRAKAMQLHTNTHDYEDIKRTSRRNQEHERF